MAPIARDGDITRRAIEAANVDLERAGAVRCVGHGVAERREIRVHIEPRVGGELHGPGSARGRGGGFRCIASRSCHDTQRSDRREHQHR